MLMDLCNPEFSSTPVISFKVFAKTFKDYKIANDSQHLYALDFLIPVSLGGSSAIDNIWPMRLKTKWNYSKKQALNKKLNWMVCNAQLSLGEARQAIKENWIQCYVNYVDSTSADKVLPDSITIKLMDSVRKGLFNKNRPH
jgi:hypothetical protein